MDKQLIILNKLDLFNRMNDQPNMTGDNAELIINELKNRDFTLEEVEYFINNYKNIEYNNDNICKYCDLVFFFGLPMYDQFMNHIINNYIFKQLKLLDKICGYCNVITKIIDN